MIWAFLTMNIMLNIIFFMLWNPLSLGLILILQTLVLSVFFGSMTTSSWFLYLLILVFIGGMLVLFIYVTSIFPNEKFSFNQKLMLAVIMIVTCFLVILAIANNMFMLNLNLNSSVDNINMKNNLLMLSTSKIFSTQNNWIMIFLVNYLFYCMMVVIKMTNFFSGPLRKMF